MQAQAEHFPFAVQIDGITVRVYADKKPAQRKARFLKVGRRDQTIRVKDLRK